MLFSCYCMVKIPENLKAELDSAAESYAKYIDKNRSNLKEFDYFRKDRNNKLKRGIPGSAGVWAEEDLRKYSAGANKYFKTKTESFLNQNTPRISRNKEIKMPKDKIVPGLREKTQEQGSIAEGFNIYLKSEFFRDPKTYVDGLKAKPKLSPNDVKNALVNISQAGKKPGGADGTYMLGLSDEATVKGALEEAISEGPDACHNTLSVIINLSKNYNIDPVGMITAAIDGKVTIGSLEGELDAISGKYFNERSSILASLLVRKHGKEAITKDLNEALKLVGYKLSKSDPDFRELTEALMIYSTADSDGTLAKVLSSDEMKKSGLFAKLK